MSRQGHPEVARDFNPSRPTHPARRGATGVGAANPGLYLHIPFCAAVCPYCDFAVLKAGAPRRVAFVGHLIAEMERRGVGAAEPPFPDPRPFDTVYLGGGTPSHLEAEQLADLLAAARRHLNVAADARISLEANPEDATPESLAAWHRLGARTLSLGVQALSAEDLAFLGRHHTPAQARQAVEGAKAAGFETVSIDLIYGLPGQTAAAWRRALEAVAALEPDHLSCYQLTYHEGTPFGLRHRRGELAELPEEGQAELFLLTHRLLADLGYAGYEVSNFARAPEHRSRHNRKYWDHTPYLGLGPAAHSFDGRRRRWWNERRLTPYQHRLAAGEDPVAGSEELTSSDLALEALMLALRTCEGVDLAAFEERYGIDLAAANASLLERLSGEGLLAVEGGHLRPTLPGLAVADSLAAAFALPLPGW